MDDFEKDYPDFDWRNTPTNQHPGKGKTCMCPRCEYIKEQVKTRHNLIKNGGGSRDPALIHIKLCPEHHRLYHSNNKQILQKASWKNKIIIKLVLWLGLVKITELKYAQSDLCYGCKYGSGYRLDKKTEMPHPPTG